MYIYPDVYVYTCCNIHAVTISARIFSGPGVSEFRVLSGFLRA